MIIWMHFAMKSGKRRVCGPVRSWIRSISEEARRPTLEPHQLERLLSEVEKCFDISHIKEYTVEAGRPDSITWEKLAVIRKHPVTRISINPQTMNQKTLDIIGRRHTVEDIRKAFADARELGFDNINMDLIVGLPGEGIEEVEHTMQEVLSLDPDSITVHSLAHQTCGTSQPV